jgi:tetratricopeptide (TPR) repeat protein
MHRPLLATIRIPGPLRLLLLCAFMMPLHAEEPMELPDTIHARIEQLSAEGDALAERERYADAIARYRQALALLPEPKTQWEAGTWLHAAIGDAQFLDRDYEAAARTLSEGMHYPDAIGNPFIHLRLGQSRFELGDRERAADELARAYMGAGREIFDDEDPKYFAFLKTVLKPPANGRW